MKKRIFSGIQPSGDLHIGNYLGAIKNWVNLQDEHENIFCVVDLHAITVPQEPALLKKRIIEIANVYLASGIDPKKSKIFVQSSRPEHAELGWILNCFTYFGEMKRMTQFKDKAGSNQESVSMGLFDYPALMAADILLYNTHLVPVGKDQFQHLELTRTIAKRFNNKYGNILTLPEPFYHKESVMIMGLDEPTKKMAKSAKSENNYIALKDPENIVRKKIAKAVTDSGSEIKSGEDKPALTNLLNIFASFSGKKVAELEKHYQGKTYKEFKDDLADTIISFLNPFQKKLTQLEKDKSYTEKVLKDGAQQVAPIAQDTLTKVKKVIGLGL